MSDTTTQVSRGRSDWMIAGAIGLALLVGMFLLSGQRQQVLRNSPSGFDGLQIWLSANGHNTQSFTGGWTVNAENISSIVLPLYDTDLNIERTAPSTQKELLFQQDEGDQYKWSILDRADTVYGLIILPKWRSGMRLTGLAHPALLVEQDRLSNMYRDLMDREEATVTRIPVPFKSFDYTGADDQELDANLYIPQIFIDDSCEPIIGDGDAMILGECPLPESDGYTWVLSDPDLLNNHGLRLGDNAKIALDLLAPDAEHGLILIDYARQNWLQDHTPVTKRDRTWADLKRFFQQPFTTLWVGLAAVLALFLWRAGLRHGPAHAVGGASGASKFLAIGAQARLLRLTGQDGALLSDYAKARVASAATDRLGPTTGRSGGDAPSLIRHLSRTRPDLAQQLESLLSDIYALPPNTGAAQAIGHVDALETLLETIANDT